MLRFGAALAPDDARGLAASCPCVGGAGVDVALCWLGVAWCGDGGGWLR